MKAKPLTAIQALISVLRDELTILENMLDRLGPDFPGAADAHYAVERIKERLAEAEEPENTVPALADASLAQAMQWDVVQGNVRDWLTERALRQQRGEERLLSEVFHREWTR